MIYKPEFDETILYEDTAYYQTDELDGQGVHFILTSKNLVFEKKSGIIHKKAEILDLIPLSDIKVYNGKVQCKTQSEKLIIQTINKNIKLSFDNMFEAKKVCIKIIDIISNTSMAERGAQKIKSAIDLVDNTLECDTKGIVKDIVIKGVGTTILFGLKKKAFDKNKRLK